MNHQTHYGHPDPDQTIVILDTETTGLDHKTERIIEIAAVKLKGQRVIESFTALVNPEVPIRHSSFLIHGISEEMVLRAPVIEEVLPQFLSFIGDLPYAAHNAIFDYSFINQACKRVNAPKFRNHRVDTLEMYRNVFPDEPSHGLSSMLNRFGFNPEVKHRALNDAIGLAQVYPLLRNLYFQKFSWQFTQLNQIEYLIERYLRIQRAIHALQSEMSDLKEVFKLHFKEGGGSIEASTGEMMISSTRRSYEYDDERVWPVVLENGYTRRAAKLTPRLLDKLIGNSSVPDEIRLALKESRTGMLESRTISFIKPQPVSEQQGELQAISSESRADGAPEE